MSIYSKKKSFNFTFKNSTSGNYFLILGIVFIILTFFSTYILSTLITQISEKSNAEMTQRSFLKRREVVAQEFSRLQKPEEDIALIVETSRPENLVNNLNVVSSMYSGDTIIKNKWFQLDDQKIHSPDVESPVDLELIVKNFSIEIGDKSSYNKIINDKDAFFWRIYSKTIAPNGTIVRYGYDIDLESLQSYFYTIDQNEPNYAFVFDRAGTILYHPEGQLLKKNIFEVTNLTEADTTFDSKTSFTKKIALSEYLNLDIVRFTKRLGVKDTDWYICVNLPQEISNENVYQVKKYASLIYFITAGILIVLVYVFIYFNRKSFREKELLAEDRNTLLVENEIISKEKALIQLQQLKEQINPHFLFNSLNSLYMLIETNTIVAKKFTLNLSKIYRYLINPPLDNIVTLQEELFFIEKYIFLQQTRFTEEFVFTITIIDEEALTKKVPYLSFQIAIENAIKHNKASEETPLKISIEIQKNVVIITNNLNEKQNSDKESKFGHKYLESIYNYYSRPDFRTFKIDGNFVCILPIIN